MLLDVAILFGTLTLMGVAAWHANGTLPAGRLPMGRTEEANTNRLLVLMQMPLIFLVVLVIIGLKDVFESELSTDGILAPVPLASLSVVVLAAQQAQFWGIRRIMRQNRPPS